MQPTTALAVVPKEEAAPAKRVHHSEEFKVRALQIVASGRRVEEVAKDVGVHPMTIRKWIRMARDGKPSASARSKKNGGQVVRTTKIRTAPAVKQTRGRYSDDFRAKALMPILAGKISVQARAAQLGISMSNLFKWAKEARGGGSKPTRALAVRAKTFGLDKARGHALAASGVDKRFTPLGLRDTPADRSLRVQALTSVLDAVEHLDDSEMAWVLRLAAGIRHIESEGGSHGSAKGVHGRGR